MAAANLALTGVDQILCGSTYTRTVTLIDSGTGLPMDLTNKVPRMQFRAAVDNDNPPAAAILTLAPAGSPPLGANESGVEVVSPATNGQINIRLSHTDTDTLQVNGTVGGKHDVEFADSVTGVVDRYLEGDWAADRGITRS